MTSNKEFDAYNEIKVVKEYLLLSIKEELDAAVPGDEIYFHDLVHQTVDLRAGRWSRHDQLDIIDFTNNYEYVDSGVIDDSSLNRHLMTAAFECLRIELFNDDIVQKLQSELNNRKFESDEAIEELKETVEAQLERIDT